MLDMEAAAAVAALMRPLCRFRRIDTLSANSLANIIICIRPHLPGRVHDIKIAATKVGDPTAEMHRPSLVKVHAFAMCSPGSEIADVYRAVLEK